MPRFDVTSFGEGQLRYCVPAGTRMERVSQFDVYVSGTEANVTGLLSRLGWSCGWVSALPDTALGNRVANEYKMAGLDISAVRWVKDGRLATYYVEYSVPPRSTTVMYDRKNTPFSQLTVDQIDWEYLLDTRLVHLSGITVPLSDSVREIITEAVRRAREKRIPVSFDTNYRSRLWTPDEAAQVSKPLIEQVDVFFCERSSAQRLYACSGTPREMIQQLGEMIAARYLVISLGEEGLIGWDREQFYEQPAREVGIVDRIGAGDAMVAGVLHGWLQGDFAKGIRYGAVTAALALSQYGDQVMTTNQELEELLNEGNTGKDISR